MKVNCVDARGWKQTVGGNGRLLPERDTAWFIRPYCFLWIGLAFPTLSSHSHFLSVIPMRLHLSWLTNLLLSQGSSLSKTTDSTCGTTYGTFFSD